MKLKAILLISLLMGSMFVFPVSAFDKEVYDFDRIFYHSINGFNKNGDGTLILAVTYINNSFRVIDYCSIEFYQYPFYFSIEFQDELEIQYDIEGNIVYQEPSDGYVFLRKSVVDTYIPKIKELATKGVNYKTITFQSTQWYRIYVPDFNNKYEWKQYQNPIINEEWYTWGNDDSIAFSQKAMFIKQTKETQNNIEFDFSHPTDNSGQNVSFSKSYLLSKGITIPYFEWGEKIPWKVISYTQNTTHYFINPEHFSIVGIHEATSGEQRALIVNTTDDIDDKTINSHVAGSGGTQWGDRYESLEDDWGEITSARIYYCSIPQSAGFLANVTVGIADSSGNWIVNINENKSVTTYDISRFYSDYDFTDIFLDNQTEYRLRVHIHWSQRTNLKWNYAFGNSYAYGHADIHATNDYMFILYGKTNGSYINITRSVGASSERNVANGTLLQSFANVTCVKIKVPVSDSTQGISEVLNQTTMNIATNVSALAGLINNTYYYDSANQFIYIGTENLSTGQLINWSVNCTYGAEFDVEPPTFVVLGLPFEFIGLIKDSSGIGIDGYIATTRIMYTNGTNAIDPVEYNCTNGNIFCTISTCSLTPGEYDWQISFYDPGSGVTFKKGGDLSVSTGVHGHYDANAIFHVYDDSTGTASHSPQFTFYDPSMGIGINTVILKLYVSEDTTFTESDRVYQQDFSTYTGQTLYYKVLDYFNNTIYPDYGGYASVVINSVNQFIDIPIQMWMFSVKNMNHSIVLFELHNGTRAYQAYLFPYEPFYWYVFNGTYDINLTYINPVSGVAIDWLNTSINIDNHTYYWIKGYDLQDIILEVQITNTTIGGLVLSVTANIELVNSTVVNITTSIISNLSITESNITTLMNLVWNSINITDSVIDYLNSTVNVNILRVNTTINYINDTVWQNFTLINQTINETTLNILLNINLSEANLSSLNLNIWADFNLTDAIIGYLNNTMWANFTMINVTVDEINNKLSIDFDMLNVTIDYLNNTIWSNFTVVGSDIDNLNISIHSIVALSEINVSNLIYNVWNALNISNATIDYLNASIWNNLSIIQSSLNNTNLTITNMILLMENNITSLVITIENIIDFALMPDIVIWSRNPPMVFSVYDKEGMAIGGNIIKICPALITIATTRVETTGNWINSTAQIPYNGTVENGTITILEDVLYISGSGSISYINITYTDNGTLMQNTTYIPSKINLYGENLTINASGDIHILRETQYHQLYKFYWDYNAITGEHTAGIDIINPMAVPIYDVYVYVEFSNNSTVNPNTIIMRDTANDGVILKRGKNYDIGLISIHFYLLSINASSTRGFTIEYTKQFDDAYRYGEETVSIPTYDKTVWNGLSFNTFIVNWANEEDTIFRGALYAKLNFEIPTEINKDSVRIWDDDNNCELDSSSFIPSSGFIRIGADGIGDVSPGGGRSFQVYFLMTVYPGADPTKFTLNTQIFWGITPFLIILLVGLILIGYSAYVYVYKEKKDWKNGIVLGVFIIFIFSVLSHMGV